MKRLSLIALVHIATACVAGCGSDDSSGPADGMVEVDAPIPEAGAPGDATLPPPDGGDAASVGVATFPDPEIRFGSVGCGEPAVTRAFRIANTGQHALVLTAVAVGSAFDVSPSMLSVPAGATGSLTLKATVSAAAMAGQNFEGSLNLFTNDPGNASVAFPLSAIATGATLAVPSGGSATVDIPTTAVGHDATPTPVSLVNVGNAPLTLDFTAPADPHFTVTGALAGVTLGAGQSWSGAVGFRPTDVSQVTASLLVASHGTLCGTSVSSVSLKGQGALGNITGWPSSTIDFGSVDCGTTARATKSFVLTNVGKVDAALTSVTMSDPSFATTASAGQSIPAGGSLQIFVRAPAVPTPSPLTALSATLTIKTDAETAPHTITLTEQPRGAILSFATTPDPFGDVVLLRASTKTFSLQNKGTAPADVALSTSGPFQVSAPTLTLAPNTPESDSVTFTPVVANGASGLLTLSTSAPLCQPLPAPVPLAGVGVGGGPTVAPTSLSFAATCGGGAPQAKAFTVRNDGQVGFTWTMSAVTGAGASRYTVSASPPPGRLAPGESSVVTVTPQAVPSPATDPSPSAYDAQLAIDTDVPLDSTHVVALGTTPIGDQLSVSVDRLRFGQIPVGTDLSQPFTVTNRANPGSPAANVTASVTGAGLAAYAVAPSAVPPIAPGATSGAEAVTFTPPSAAPFPASVTLATSDPLCTPLPAPVALTGEATAGRILVSASSLAFGPDPADARGLVACGATGPARSFTVSNVGNQAAKLTGLTLAKGSTSPYGATTGPPLPVDLPVGGAVTVVITPKAIPAAVSDPSDASPFGDTLTVTTDAANDPPHTVALAMQARGAILVDSPLTTTWTFGTVGYGSIGTFTSTLRNTGNAPATVSLTGLAQPAIFGLHDSPTTIAPGGAVTSLVGQFTPPSSNGTWSDRGALTATADAFCAPVPATWASPTISLSGASNATPPATVSGTLNFPTTSCGDAPPGARSVTVTNGTNQALPFTAALRSGVYYTLNAPSGTLPASGATTLTVTPKLVAPGPGVVPGAAPYVDDLLVTVQTTPTATLLVVPVTWTLAGAVLSLPQGAGPASDAQGGYYPADSSGTLTLPIDNTGTASATVTVTASPPGALSVAPSGPISVLPGVRAAPQLLAGASAAACPASTPASLTFFYSGPVCQPLPLSSVRVHSCSGAIR